MAMAVEKYGRIDGLVYNAGRNDNVGLEMGTIDRFTTSLNENLLHYYEMAHYCLPELKKTKGSILNISSKVALTGKEEPQVTRLLKEHNLPLLEKGN